MSLVVYHAHKLVNALSAQKKEESPVKIKNHVFASLILSKIHKISANYVTHTNNVYNANHSHQMHAQNVIHQKVELKILLMESANVTKVLLKMMILMIVSHVLFQDVNNVIKLKLVKHVLLKNTLNKLQKMEHVFVKLIIILLKIKLNAGLVIRI